MSVEKTTRDLELKKHVGSIHCSNTLSLLQRKISNVLLYHAYEQLLDKEEHAITVKSLCGLIGYASHDTDGIKRALKALISTVIEWNLLGDTKSPTLEEDWNASSILASVGIKGGICTYSYSHRLKQLLYMPEVYGRINIAVQAKFKSNYALALYENCIRYQNLSHTRWFSLPTFRKLMGVPDNKYRVFRDFKRRVLDKSVEEVNQYADIHVQPEIERQGHQVNRIRFKLHSTKDKHKEVIEQEDPTVSSDDLVTTLTKEFGLSMLQAQKTLAVYDADYVMHKMDIVKQALASHSKGIKNVTAYLMSALKEDYQTPLPRKKRDSKTTTGTSEEGRAAQLHDQYCDAIEQLIDQAYQALDQERLEALLSEFETKLRSDNNAFVCDKFHRMGLQNRIVRSLFRTFLKEQHAEVLPTLPTFEAFCATLGTKKVANA